MNNTKEWEIIDIITSPDISYEDRFVHYIEYLSEIGYNIGEDDLYYSTLLDCVNSLYSKWNLIINSFPNLRIKFNQFSLNTYNPYHLESLYDFCRFTDNYQRSDKLNRLRMLTEVFLDQKTFKKDWDFMNINIRYYNYLCKMMTDLRGFKYVPIIYDINLFSENYYVNREERIVRRYL